MPTTSRETNQEVLDTAHLVTYLKLPGKDPHILQLYHVDICFLGLFKHSKVFHPPFLSQERIQQLEQLLDETDSSYDQEKIQDLPKRLSPGKWRHLAAAQ